MEWAHAVFQFLGRFGAGVLYYSLGLAWLFASAAGGFAVYKWTEKRWAGWLSGLLAAILLMAIFGSAIEAVHRATCYGVHDFEGCMTDDEDSN